MEYVYGFTSDNEKVIIGTVEEIQPGFTVVIPSDYTPDAYLMVSVNGGTAQTMSSLLAGGRTLNNVESLYFTSSDSTGRGVGCGFNTGNSNNRVYVTWSDYNHSSQYRINEPYSYSNLIESALLEFSQNIEFSSFSMCTYKYSPKD